MRRFNEDTYVHHLATKGDVDHRAAAAHILPLAGGRRSHPQATPAIFIALDPASLPAELGTAARIFGLTPAEARQLKQLMVCATLHEAVAALQVSEATARTHRNTIAKIVRQRARSATSYKRLSQRLAAYSSNTDLGVGNIFIFWRRQILRRRSFPNAAGGIVVRPVAGVEPSTIVTLLAERHTSQVRANTDHHQHALFTADNAVLIGRVGIFRQIAGQRIDQVGDQDGLGFFDFFGRPGTDEDRMDNLLKAHS